MTEVKGFSIHAHDYHTDKTVFITNTAYDVNTVTITMRDVNYHSPDLSSGINVGEINMTIFDFLNFVTRLNSIAEKITKETKVPDVTIGDGVVEAANVIVEHHEETKKRRGRPKKNVNTD